MAKTTTGEDYIPYAELTDEQRALTDHQEWIQRENAARNGWGLDKLVDDDDGTVRLAVARHGYGSEKLRHDDVTMVKIALAEQGLQTRYFANNEEENWMVKLQVARRGFCLDGLVNDSYERVREAAQSRLEDEWKTLEEWISENPGKCAREASAIASRLYNDIDMMNVRTGEVAIPDITIEDDGSQLFHGIRSFKVSRERAREILEGGEDARAGQWGLESIPAPGSGAAERMGFSGVDSFEELMEISERMAEEPGWEMDSRAAVERFAANIERPAAMWFAEAARDKTTPDFEPEIAAMEYDPFENTYRIDYDMQNSFQMQPIMTDDGLVWDWEMFIGGETYSGRANEMHAALMKSRTGSAAVKRAAFNEEVEDKNKLPDTPAKQGERKKELQNPPTKWREDQKRATPAEDEKHARAIAESARETLKERNRARSR